MKIKIETIVWFDCSQQRGELTADEVVEGVVLVSSGILLKETDAVVTIAQDWQPREGTYRWVSSIPKRCILSRKQATQSMLSLNTLEAIKGGEE